MSQYPITDDGRRLADAHEEARRSGGAGRWIAVRLSTGGTNGAIYDRRDQALKHGGSLTFPLLVQVGPMPPAEGTAVVEIHRRARKGGLDFIDPAQTPLRPLSGPLPTTGAAHRLIERGFHLPHTERMRGPRGRRP